MIEGVNHVQVSIPVGAEAEAREFYCDFLGLVETPKPKALEGRGGFWLEAGGFPVHFGVEDGIERQKSKAHVAYQVNDLAGWRRRLESRGIAVTEGIPIPGTERFEFRDPFGNRVEFMELSR